MRAAPNGRSCSCATGSMPLVVAGRTRKQQDGGLLRAASTLSRTARRATPGTTRRAGGKVFRMALDRDTLAQLLDTVERFVTERLRPLEERVAEEDRIPPDIVAEMRGLGLFGLSIPEEHGGLGLTMSEEAQVAFRLGRTSPAFRSLIGTNNGIGSQGIVIDGTPEQKAHWLPRMASGEIVGSFCLTEPEAGSDAGSLRTSARRDGNDAYVITGTKRFITNAPSAGLFTVFARTDPQSTDARGVSAFLVAAQTPGITLGAPDKKMGQKGAQTCDVIFEEVRVPADAIIGGPAREGQGFSGDEGARPRAPPHQRRLRR